VIEKLSLEGTAKMKKTKEKGQKESESFFVFLAQSHHGPLIGGIVPYWEKKNL